jgi:hypothetical protein
MSNTIDLVKSVNFGSGKGSLSTVGYRLVNKNGSLSGSRVTSGIGEVLSNAGIYSASIHFTSTFSGSILWDTGESTPVYATEDYNGTDFKIERTKDLTAGRWKIDEDTKQMIFYKEDNTTEISRYNLFDESGAASVSSVFDRRKV